MHSLGKIVQCAQAVGWKMWCLFFVCHAPIGRVICLSGIYFEQLLCRCLWVDFDAIFTVFLEGIGLLEAVHNSHIRR